MKETLSESLSLEIIVFVQIYTKPAGKKVKNSSSIWLHLSVF